MTLRSAPAGAVDWTEPDYRGLMRSFPDGVYDGLDSLKVTASGQDRTVRVSSGRGRVQGAALFGDPGVTGNSSAAWCAEFDLTAPASGLYRCDLIAMRYDPNGALPPSDRVTIIRRLGATASTRDGAPRPSLTRSATGAWEVPLAWVRAGSVAVTQADVEDARILIDVQPAIRSLYHPAPNVSVGTLAADGSDSLISGWGYTPGDAGYGYTGDIDYGQGIVTINIPGYYRAHLTLGPTNNASGSREAKIIDADSGAVYARGHAHPTSARTITVDAVMKKRYLPGGTRLRIIGAAPGAGSTVSLAALSGVNTFEIERVS